MEDEAVLQEEEDDTESVPTQEKEAYFGIKKTGQIVVLEDIEETAVVGSDWTSTNDV